MLPFEFVHRLVGKLFHLAEVMGGDLQAPAKEGDKHPPLEDSVPTLAPAVVVPEPTALSPKLIGTPQL